ncbi:MAG: SPOR domain-containing protein [Bacteroidia bacterium]|jgi:nucleoid DNA-binding protein|nr:SPOR domain-containing protein [Bacteroidia bacterium]
MLAALVRDILLTTQPAIWNHIRDLLMKHDCVIVPGFGGFVCNREPSKIDQVSHVITPPSRKVVFNQNLKTNDGLLIGYIAVKEQLQYSEALIKLNTIVQSFMAQLAEKKQLTIDFFGTFRLNAEANFVFIPDKRNNYLDASFGLMQIQATPAAQRLTRSPRTRIFKDRKETKAAKRNRNVWPGVLVGVLVMLLSINGYIFLKEHSLNDLRIGHQTMSITSWFDSVFKQKPNPVTVNTDTVVSQQSEVEVVQELPAASDPTADTVIPAELSANATTESSVLEYADLYAFATHIGKHRGTIYVPHKHNQIEEIITPEETSTTPELAKVSTQSLESGYYVIGGVFCKKANAKRFLKRLKDAGYNQAELLLNEYIHCNRVSYQRFSTKKEAEQFCKQLSSENPSAWILEAV